MRLTTRFSSTFLLLAASLTAALAPGCSAPMDQGTQPSEEGARTVPPEEVATTKEALTSAGIERVIPVRFIEFRNTGAAPITTPARAERALVMANEAFRQAGIQLRVGSLESYEMPVVWGNKTAPAPLPLLTWAQVSSDITKAYPSAANAANVPADYSTKTLKGEDWLALAAMDFGSPDAIQVFLGPNGNGYSGWPSMFASAYLPSSSINENNLLTHELGHFFGLVHGWDSPVDLINGAGAVLPEDEWDMIFCPGPGNNPPHKFFQTKSEVHNYTCTNQYQHIQSSKEYMVGMDKHQYATSCTAINPTTDQPVDKEPCCMNVTDAMGHDTNRVTCYVGVSGHTLKKYSTGDTEIRGISTLKQTPTGMQPSVNSMTYLGSQNDAMEVGPLIHFSESQVEQIRRSIHYDVASNDAGIASPRWTGRRGGRVTLGAGSSREPTYNLDFDGDGRRDIAFWQPASTNRPKGRFTVYLSNHFANNVNGTPYDASPQMIVEAGELGDVPALADYDGDGLTDFIVVGAGASGASNSFTTWKICRNRIADGWYGSCDPQPNLVFGQKGDVPISGVDMDADGNEDLVVYSPPSSTFYWAFGPSFTLWGSKTFPSMPANAQPMVGRYDQDDIMDLVVYDPKVATFYMKTSSSSWATTTRSFPASYRSSTTGSPDARSTSTLVRGMARTASQNGAMRTTNSLALWDVESGRWGIMWTPVDNATLSECVFGVRGDRPLGGLGIHTNSASRAYPSVYRISDHQATLWSISPTDSGCGTYSQTSHGGGVVANDMVFPVADINGDQMPDLVRVDPGQGQLIYYTSPNYSTATTIHYGDSSYEVL